MSPEEIQALRDKEHLAACNDLETVEPTIAVIRFYKRLDELSSITLDASEFNVACKSGCYYCCYYKVEAKPAEIFRIVEFLKKNFTSAQLQLALKQARKNVEEAKHLTHAQHLATNQQCPFLIDNKCSIYAVRPSKCRNFHAQDVDGCQKSYEEPTNLEVPNSYIPELHFKTEAATDAFEAAIARYGFNANTYDLNSAIVEAFSNPALKKRFNKGKKPFIKATKVELPG